MPNQLKYYPSGFLGSPDVEQTKALDITTTAKALFNKGLNPIVSKYTANQEVVDIWDDVISGHPDYKTFEFKERVLRAAKRAFGTVTLVDWVGSQSQSPYFTDIHFRWIDETMLYVFGGKAREMSSNNWKTLLVTGGDRATRDRFSNVVKHHLLGEKMKGSEFAEPYRGNMTMDEFLVAWCRAPAGHEDLTTSLNVLFGKR